MMQEYTSNHVAALYGLNNQTVHNWAQEFKRHLSPGANPGQRRPRLFTGDDMRVISLIAEMKQSGKQYADIHAALDAGQKGEGIATPPDELDAMIEGQDRTALVVQNEELQRRLEALSKELSKIRDLELQNAGLVARIDELEKQVQFWQGKAGESDALREQIGELRGELKTIKRQLGQE